MFVAHLDVDGASVSLMTATTSRTTLHASDATAQRLEDLQFSLGEGACMEAEASGAPVVVEDIRDRLATAGWPIFAAAAAEEGDVGMLIALPLRWGAVALGVLCLYRKLPGPLSAGQLREALNATDIATLMVLSMRTDPGDGAWLDRAISGRIEVHQATGMVIAQLDISASDALARLRATAFVQNRQLMDVARDVIARRLDFTHDPT